MENQEIIEKLAEHKVAIEDLTKCSEIALDVVKTINNNVIHNAKAIKAVKRTAGFSLLACLILGFKVRKDRKELKRLSKEVNHLKETVDDIYDYKEVYDE